MNKNTIEEILINTLSASKKKDFAGYSKFDALNSRTLKFLSFNNAWLRFAWTQFIKISPVNLRPLFRVKISRNPKGIALFVRAYLFLYEKTKNIKYLEEAKILLQWLIENKCNGFSEYSWGYNYTWQNVPPFIQHKGEPCIIVSIFAGEAFIHAYRNTNDDKYLRISESVCRFIINSFTVLYEDNEKRAISYTLNKEKRIVINIQALSAALFTKVWKHNHDSKLLNIAKKQINFVISKRNDECSWHYSYPSESYHGVDNYHTGGILDALLEYYEETGDKQYMPIYWQGLEYYRKFLFEPDGAPRWMNTKKYPYDVHGAAQGIISFVKASKHDNNFFNFANIITDWSLNNLYRSNKKDFIYRQGRFYKYNFSLMHWCNGWMTRALSEFIKKN